MPRRDSGFGYQPALDGVRAVAVSLVLLFHGGFAWMSAGYVGVSVFFTLSGFLITSLLIIEHERTGRIRAGEFYRRRLKRLLPASMVCLAGVIVLARAGMFRGVPNVRRDILGAVFQVANWTKLTEGTSYAELIGRLTGRRQFGPLDHYWSLAVEEQFYWVWPLAAMAIFRVARSPRARFVVLAALTAVFGALAPVIAQVWGPDAAYWATPARLGEILVGATLAYGMHVWRSRPAWLSLFAVAGMSVVIAVACTWPSATGPAYSGYLPLFAVASAAVIAGLQVASPLRAALSWRPVVLLGTVSYGVYLYHWPIFAVLDEERMRRSGWQLFAVQLAVTLAVSALSYVLVERPVRQSTFGLQVTASTALAACLVVAVLAVVVPQAASSPAVASAPGVELQPVDSLPPLVATTTSTTTPATVAPTAPLETLPTTTLPTTTSTGATTPPTLPPIPVPVRPVRMLVIGDSTAEATSLGLVPWAADNPDLARVTTIVGPGCGLLRDGTPSGDPQNVFKAACDQLMYADLPQRITELKPDVAIVMVTLSDLDDRTWTKDEGELSPLDPRFAARMEVTYRAFADQLLVAGVGRIAWVRPPIPSVYWQGDAAGKLGDPRRYDVQHTLIDRLAAERPDKIQVVPMDTWLTSVGGDHDAAWRPDGIHWSVEAAHKLVDDFLADRLLRIALL